MVATEIAEAIKSLAENFPGVKLIERAFEPEDLDDKEIVIVAVNDNQPVIIYAFFPSKKKLLVNVADTPRALRFLPWLHCG
ncbi:MAG: NAD(P)-dependent oxidoreductase [Puia sp.]